MIMSSSKSSSPNYFLLLVLLSVVGPSLAISTDDLYMIANAQSLPDGDDEINEVTLNSSFQFFGSLYSIIYVSTRECCVS